MGRSGRRLNRIIGIEAKRVYSYLINREVENEASHTYLDAVLWRPFYRGHENLVKNPGFEDALKGWGAGWRNDLVEPAVDNTVMHGPGTGSLVLRGEAGKAGGWVQQDIRDLPKGHKKFKASVWVKMKNFALGWQGIVTIEYIGENGKWLGITTLATPWDQSAGDVDWRKLEKEFEIKEGTELLRIGLVIRKSAGWDAKGAPYTGTIWYDDIWRLFITMQAG